MKFATKTLQETLSTFPKVEEAFVSFQAAVAEVEETEVDDDEDEEAAAKRPRYCDSCPASELNDDGKLIGEPQNFDSKEHLAPKKADFEDEVHYMLFKAGQFEVEAEYKAKRAASLRKQADTLSQYGDPAQRAKIMKVAKMTEALANLRETLAAEGLDLSALSALAADAADAE